eukprot:5131784-Amphidinium_carterae.1
MMINCSTKLRTKQGKWSRTLKTRMTVKFVIIIYNAIHQVEGVPRNATAKSYVPFMGRLRIPSILRLARCCCSPTVCDGMTDTPTFAQKRHPAHPLSQRTAASQFLTRV